MRPPVCSTRIIRLSQILLQGRSKDPSSQLLDVIAAHCSVSPVSEMQHCLSELGAEFQRAYAGTVHIPITNQQESVSSGENMATSAAQQRLQLGFTFFYMVLESILLDEVRKVDRKLRQQQTDAGANRRKPDFNGLLSQDLFHRSLFACCMELVLLSCDPPERHFPWILDALSLDALHFFKVILSPAMVFTKSNCRYSVLRMLHAVANIRLL